MLQEVLADFIEVGRTGFCKYFLWVKTTGRQRALVVEINISV